MWCGLSDDRSTEPAPETENGRKHNSPHHLAEIVAGGGEQGNDFVTFLTGEMVAVQAVVTFHMVDRGLNGRPAFEHTADGAG